MSDRPDSAAPTDAAAPGQWPATPAEAQAPVTPGQDAPVDCLVIGGGPAGLTAAIYLGRFRRRVMLVDRGDGRLKMIPRSHNHAGYPEGVVGTDLIENMAAQARMYGAELEQGEVTTLGRDGEGFRAEWSGGAPIRARTVLIATGVVNHRPPLAEAIHDDAVQRGLLRYCPICDAFEQAGRRIGVLGGDRHGLAEALFLRSYSPDITLLSLTGESLDATEQDEARIAGVTVIPAPVSGFDFDDDTLTLTLADGDRVTLDTLYVALGSHTRNGLGMDLGTELVEGECFATDPHQRTSVEGVYAAGDAVEGLDQISVAMGTGARAAVAIHNDLRARDGQVLKD